MSAIATAAVFQHSKSKLAARLVLLAIADRAHEDGSGCYYSVTTIADKANVSERQTFRALKHLEAVGELLINSGGSPQGTNEYAILLPGLGDDKLSGGGDKRADRMSPNTSTDKSFKSGDKKSGSKADLLKSWQNRGCQHESAFCDRRFKFCTRCAREKQKIEEGRAA